MSADRVAAGQEKGLDERKGGSDKAVTGVIGAFRTNGTEIRIARMSRRSIEHLSTATRSPDRMS